MRRKEKNIIGFNSYVLPVFLLLTLTLLFTGGCGKCSRWYSTGQHSGSTAGNEQSSRPFGPRLEKIKPRNSREIVGQYASCDIEHSPVYLVSPLDKCVVSNDKKPENTSKVWGRDDRRDFLAGPVMFITGIVRLPYDLYRNTPDKKQSSRGGIALQKPVSAIDSNKKCEVAQIGKN